MLELSLKGRLDDLAEYADPLILAQERSSWRQPEHLIDLALNCRKPCPLRADRDGLYGCPFFTLTVGRFHKPQREDGWFNPIPLKGYSEQIRIERTPPAQFLVDRRMIKPQQIARFGGSCDIAV